MNTRLRTRIRAGGSRFHYQQFDYSSSDTEHARSEDLLSGARDHPEAEPPALFEASMPPDEPPPSLKLPMSMSYHYFPNLKLSRRFLNLKMFPLQQRKPKYC